MKILIIEDNQYKITQMLAFLANDFPMIGITIKNSYHSGLKEIKQYSLQYNLILLDISMPTYDIKAGEHGGTPLPLAGKLILNEMNLRDIRTKVIVVTMYENYVDGTKLLELDKQFTTEFDSNYMGYVYFSPDDTIGWKENLKIKIQTLL